MCMYHFYNTFGKTCINHDNLVLECWKIYSYYMYIYTCILINCAMCNVQQFQITVLMECDPCIKLKLYGITKCRYKWSTTLKCNYLHNSITFCVDTCTVSVLLMFYFFFFFFLLFLYFQSYFYTTFFYKGLCQSERKLSNLDKYII